MKQKHAMVRGVPVELHERMKQESYRLSAKLGRFVPTGEAYVIAMTFYLEAVKDNRLGPVTQK